MKDRQPTASRGAIPEVVGFSVVLPASAPRLHRRALIFAKKRRYGMSRPIYRFLLDRLSHPWSTRTTGRIARFSLVGLTLFVAVLAVRCAQPGTPADELAPADEREPVPITTDPVTVTYVSYWGSSPWINGDKKLIDRFQEAYPHVNVNRKLWRDNMSGDEYLGDPVPPDVMTWDAAVMYPLTENQDLFMDIGELWREQGWEEVIPEQLRGLSQGNGRYCHLPTHYFWIGIFYNKAIFEQYNLNPPETWDEFLDVCATLKQGGVTPIAIGLSPGQNWQTLLWFDYLNIRINGLAFRNELMLEGETRFDDDRVRAVFTTLGTLVEGGYFDENAQRRTGDGSILTVLNSEAAMTLVGHGAMDMVPQTRWNEVDLFRFPVIDPEVPLGEAPGVEGFVIPANTSELQTAIQFLAHRGSAEAQAHWAEECGPPGGVPARTDVDSAVLTPHMQKAQEMLQDTDELDQLIFWTGSPMIDVMIVRIGSWFDDPGTLNDLLDRLEARRQEVFE